MTAPDPVTADDDLVQRLADGEPARPEDGKVARLLASLRAEVLDPQGEHARLPATHRAVRGGQFLACIPVAPDAQDWVPAPYDQSE